MKTCFLGFSLSTKFQTQVPIGKYLHDIEQITYSSVVLKTGYNDSYIKLNEMLTTVPVYIHINLKC